MVKMCEKCGIIESNGEILYHTLDNINCHHVWIESEKEPKITYHTSESATS